MVDQNIIEIHTKIVAFTVVHVQTVHTEWLQHNIIVKLDRPIDLLFIFAKTLLEVI